MIQQYSNLLIWRRCCRVMTHNIPAFSHLTACMFCRRKRGEDPLSIDSLGAGGFGFHCRKVGANGYTRWQRADYEPVIRDYDTISLTVLSNIGAMTHPTQVPITILVRDSALTSRNPFSAPSLFLECITPIDGECEARYGARFRDPPSRVFVLFGCCVARCPSTLPYQRATSTADIFVATIALMHMHNRHRQR